MCVEQAQNTSEKWLNPQSPGLHCVMLAVLVTSNHPDTWGPSGMRRWPGLGGWWGTWPPAGHPLCSACHISKLQRLDEMEPQLSPQFDFCHHKGKT